MAEGEHHALLALAGEVEVADEVAAIVATGDRFHFGDVGHGGCEEVRATVDGDGIVAGRFAFHQVAQEADQLWLVGLGVGEDGVHG